MTEGHTDAAPSVDSTQTENVIPESVTSGSTNVQFATSRTAREELLPHYASKGK